MNSLTLSCDHHSLTSTPHTPTRCITWKPAAVLVGAVSPETQKVEQTDGLRSQRKPSWAADLTAPELQATTASASNQPPDSSGHPPRPARGHCLIGPSVADVQELGVDVAKSDADLFSRHAATVADRPGLEGGEDLVVGADEMAALARVGAPAAKGKASNYSSIYTHIRIFAVLPQTQHSNALLRNRMSSTSGSR